jgi:hypothetical protein
VPLRLPREGETITRQTFTFHLDKAKLQKAELRDGHYLLRSNLLGEKPEVLWELYILLTQIEAAFKTLKSDLRGFPGLRPVGHAPAPAGPLRPRVDTARRAEKTGHDANARCLPAHHRWTLADHAAL